MWVERKDRDVTETVKRCEQRTIRAGRYATPPTDTIVVRRPSTGGTKIAECSKKHCNDMLLYTRIIESLLPRHRRPSERMADQDGLADRTRMFTTSSYLSTYQVYITRYSTKSISLYATKHASPRGSGTAPGYLRSSTAS